MLLSSPELAFFCNCIDVIPELPVSQIAPSYAVQVHPLVPRMLVPAPLFSSPSYLYSSHRTPVLSRSHALTFVVSSDLASGFHTFNLITGSPLRSPRASLYPSLCLRWHPFPFSHSDSTPLRVYSESQPKLGVRPRLPPKLVGSQINWAYGAA